MHNPAHAPAVILGRVPHASRGIIDCIDVGDCWVWTGWKDPDGYGHFGRPNKIAHRLVWELLVGPIPPGYHLDHLCRNKACVNPEHLEPVTVAVNVQRTPPGRKGQHDNHVKGAAHPNARKTHCINGHEFTPENTGQQAGWKGRGARLCLTCRRLRNQARRGS